MSHSIEAPSGGVGSSVALVVGVVAAALALARVLEWVDHPPAVKQELRRFAKECPTLKSGEHLPSLLKTKVERPLTKLEQKSLDNFYTACGLLYGLE